MNATVFTAIGLLLAIVAALFSVCVTIAFVGDGFVTLWKNDVSPTWEKAAVTGGWVFGIIAIALLALAFL